MARKLDLADIQGNITRAYAPFGFWNVRYFFLHVNREKLEEARKFLDVVRERVTTSERWGQGEDRAERPKVTLNIGFSWFGLWAFGLPTETLRMFPREFIDGMKPRAHILGDVGKSAPDHWDRIWQDSNQGSGTQVHIWVSMNAQSGEGPDPVPELDAQIEWFRQEIEKSKGGVVLLSGHGPTGENDYQEAHILWGEGSGRARVPLKSEHFGYTDGIGNPVFAGQFEQKIEDVRVVGRGKLMPDQTWAPLATGEFLLGHVDESQEIPPAAFPDDFANNGTFMVYRKLHQNVKTFKEYVADQSGTYAAIMGVSKDEAAETIGAKMVGRWKNGVPLLVAPTYDDWQKFNEDWKDIELIVLKKKTGQAVTAAEQARAAEYNRILIDFKYNGDVEGYKCPVAAHIRRANTRDMLDPVINTDGAIGSALNKRRRILRRGLPYGKSDPKNPTDDGEHGIIFMAVCASLFRQFEFVQQQWMQYGLDFNVGNDTCPVIGKHEEGDKFVIASDPGSGKPPYICADPGPFVTTRGGEYFFIPSLTSLRMMAMGVVDPT